MDWRLCKKDLDKYTIIDILKVSTLPIHEIGLFLHLLKYFVLILSVLCNIQSTNCAFCQIYPCHNDVIVKF